MLSFTTLAVTIAEADAYATARGRTWAGDNATKTAALRRGQDYVAGKYNRRWLIDFEDTTAPDVVKYAIVEAAVRELAVPFSLMPDVQMGTAKVLTKVGSLGWTPVKTDAKAADFEPTIFAIRGLLSGVASMGDMPAAFAV